MKVGDIVPINLKLYDDNASAQCVAYIYNDSLEFLASRILRHVARGFYAPNVAYTFPENTKFICVVYKVYDETLTTAHARYQDAVDVFIKSDIAEIGEVLESVKKLQQQLQAQNPVTLDYVDEGTQGISVDVEEILDITALVDEG